MDGKDLIVNDPVACMTAKDFFREQTDPSAIWKNLVDAGDPVNTYGWIHAEHGKSERLTKCLIELYGNYSALFSPQIAAWFEDIKTFDQKTGDPIPVLSLDKSFPSIDRFFAKGMSLIFSPALGDKAGLMDTADCVGFLGQVLTCAHKERDTQDAAIVDAKKLAMEILIKEFPDGN